MSFFALFHTAVGLLALAFQLALSRPALQRMGLAGTVALRPAAVAVAALAGALDPRLLTALLARGAHGVLHNSLFRSGYELLFTPLPERRKRPTKTIVDVGFDKLGALAGACIALAAVSAFGSHGPRVMFAAAAASALAALAVSRRLHRGYVAALEDSLRSGVVRLEIGDVRDGTTSMTLARTGIHPAWPRRGDTEEDGRGDDRRGRWPTCTRETRRGRGGPCSAPTPSIPRSSATSSPCSPATTSSWTSCARCGARRPTPPASCWTRCWIPGGISRCAGASRASCAARRPSAPPTGSWRRSPIRASR